MLHPLVVPEQMLLFAVSVLIAGRMPAGAFASTVLAFIAGMMAGKASHLAIAWLSMFWYAPLAAALLGGLAVAAFGRFSALAGAGWLFALAFVLSVGIVPEEPTQMGIVRAVAAAALTGVILLAAIGLPLTRLNVRWGGVLVRVAGAWIAAVAMLNLALAVAMLQRAG